MRNTLLVLRYMSPSGVPPRDGEQYAGAFVTNRDVEDVFARAEPPSHDDWVKERLSDRHERSFVNVGLRRIEEKARKFISPSTELLTSTYARSVAGFADHLGGLLPGLQESAKGKMVRTPSKGGGGGGSRTKIPKVVLEAPQRQPQADYMEVEISFSIKHVPEATHSRVLFKVDVIIAGGDRERSAPEGRVTPFFKRWSIGAEKKEDAGDGQSRLELMIPAAVQKGTVTVVQPLDCVVDIDFSTEAILETEQ